MGDIEQSILTSTKKILGLADDYTEFDLDITTHINTVFTHLFQLGVGPVEGFTIDDKTAEWADFIVAGPLQNIVKTYMYLKVRMLFDPPATSYLIDAMNQQIEQQEWRISEQRESTDWVDPDPPVVSEL